MILFFSHILQRWPGWIFYQNTLLVPLASTRLCTFNKKEGESAIPEICSSCCPGNCCYSSSLSSSVRNSEIHRLWVCRLQLPGLRYWKSLQWICWYVCHMMKRSSICQNIEDCLMLKWCIQDVIYRLSVYKYAPWNYGLLPKATKRNCCLHELYYVVVCRMIMEAVMYQLCHNDVWQGQFVLLRNNNHFNTDCGD